MKGVPVHNGLRPITHDISQDFNHKRFWPIKRQLFGAASALPGLPPTLGRRPISINDQGVSNFCTAFAVSEAIGNQLGIPMSPEAQTALEGKLVGSPIFQGADPKLALSAGLEGAYPKAGVALDFNKDGWQIPAEWQSYAPGFFNFPPNGRASYYSVTDTPELDAFDDIKLALWDAMQDKVPGFTSVIPFGFWYESWNRVGADGIVPEIRPGEIPSTRHAYLYFDWITINGTEYLKAQLSQGEQFGDQGVLYFSRSNVETAWKNAMASGCGRYIFRNANPSFWTSATFTFLHGLGLI